MLHDILDFLSKPIVIQGQITLALVIGSLALYLTNHEVSHDWMILVSAAVFFWLGIKAGNNGTLKQ